MGRRGSYKVDYGGFGELVNVAMQAERADRRPWSMQDVADAVAVNRETVRNWIAGESYPEGLPLGRLCSILKLDPTEVCARLAQGAKQADKPAKSAPGAHTTGLEGEGQRRSRRGGGGRR